MTIGERQIFQWAAAFCLTPASVQSDGRMKEHHCGGSAENLVAAGLPRHPTVATLEAVVHRSPTRPLTG